MAIAAGGQTLERLLSFSQHQPDHTNSTPTGPCYFWAVPLEIRYIVYQLCYGKQREIKVASRWAWRIGEQTRKTSERRDFVPGVFPATFMGDLLVSKQYVDEAIRVWAQTKTFYFNRYYDVDPVLDSGSAIERHLLRHIRSFVISDGELILPKPAIVMSSLQYVTMPFNEMLFHCDIDKSIWHDNFTDLELVQDCQIAALLKFRGLRSLTVNWGRPIETSKPEEKAHGEKFQLQVQSLVDDVVLQPREKMGATTSPWNFQHALTEAKKARNSGRSSMMKPADQAGQNATPLRDNEVPGTENELLRLFLTRPRAMMAWHKDAKKAKAKVPKLEQELAAYSGDVGLDFS